MSTWREVEFVDHNHPNGWRATGLKRLINVDNVIWIDGWEGSGYSTLLFVNGMAYPVVGDPEELVVGWGV